MRYPQRAVYTKGHVIQIYNSTYPFTALCPKIPIDSDLGNVSKLQVRHFTVICRSIFCEFCHELNESGNRLHSNFLNCYGCRQAACAICIVLFFPFNYRDADYIKNMNEETRARAYLCLTCRCLGLSGVLVV